MKKLLVMLCAIGLILCTHNIAKATTISSFEFIGHVTFPNYYKDLPQISPGDIFTGSFRYTYDPSLVDYDPRPEVGFYDLYDCLMAVDYTLNFNSLVIKRHLVENILICNQEHDSLSILDMHAMTNWTNLGVEYAEVFFYFDDSTGTVFNDANLPVILDPNAFDDIGFSLSLWGIGCPWGSCGELYGHVDSITSYHTAVPEPGTMLLLGSGLIGLAGFRRKLRKR